MRDIAKYEDEYLREGFEGKQVEYRRKKILSIINVCKTDRMIEIGCGAHPIFEFYDKFEKYVFFEPAKKLFDNAQRIKGNDQRILGFNENFDADIELGDFNPDIILCSSLLHEIENPQKMLEDIAKISCERTLIHINVPNANSFHRVLARSMGLISDVKDMSERNKILQQNRVYDMNGLTDAVEAAGLRVVEKGSYFIKPFTHSQMWTMLKEGIITDETLDGLYTMGENDTGVGSEIYVNCRICTM